MRTLAQVEKEEWINVDLQGCFFLVGLFLAVFGSCNLKIGFVSVVSKFLFFQVKVLLLSTFPKSLIQFLFRFEVSNYYVAKLVFNLFTNLEKITLKLKIDYFFTTDT